LIHPDPVVPLAKTRRGKKNKQTENNARGNSFLNIHFSTPVVRLLFHG